MIKSLNLRRGAMFLLASIALFAVTALASAASAETFRLLAGREGGGYHNTMTVLATRLQQRGYEGVVENLPGSEAITLAACASTEANVLWIAQADAVWRRLQEGCALAELAVTTNEQAFLMVPPDSRINELSDLNEEHGVLVDNVGSGSELTWLTMAGFEREHGNQSSWASARAVNDSPLRAPALAANGAIHAVMLVRAPGSDDLARLVSQGWEYAEFYDRHLNDLEFNGRSLYESTYNRQAREYTYVVSTFIGTTLAAANRRPAWWDTVLSAVNR